MRASLDPFFLQRSTSPRYDQVDQRLPMTMKMVVKGILKDHLVLVADSMMSTGIKKRLNNAGYKVTFRPLKVKEPLTESTLFTPMKCMRRLQRCHPNPLGCVVSSCSWGKHVVLSTESSFGILQRKSAKKQQRV
jgi:DNA-directed RNA polymerase-5 subunit 1